MTDDKIILTDIDGCLLNWREGFMRFMANRDFSVKPGSENQYLLNAYYDISLEEFFEQVELFNGGRWEFGTLEPIPGAINAVEALTELGYRFVGISSCSSDLQSFVLRRANLYNVFGDVFDRVHCLALKESKKLHLDIYQPTFWIEDKMDMCLEGVGAGHKGILIDYPWNREHDYVHVERCQDWDAVVAYINTELDEETQREHY